MSGRHAGLYIRVSTDAQAEEGYSIDAQKQMLAAYCTAKAIPSHEFYIDGGFTGANLMRPELTRLIEDVKAGRVTDVIVYKLDRLSRSQKDTMYLIEDVFLPAKAAFTSISENFDTSTAFGMAMVGMLSVFAQFERDNINRRTRMGMAERVKSGLWMGGARTPFGYDYDSRTGTLIPNAQAQTVRDVFALLLEGHSPERITAMLGFKYDKIVRDILTRRTYTGMIPYAGQLYPGKHEAIISKETFEAAKRELDRRGGRRVGESDKLLTGLVYCGKCGARMRYQKWGRAGDKLYCYSQQRSKPYLVRDPQCDNEKVWAADVEALVVDALLRRGVELRAQTQKEQDRDAMTLLQAQLRQQQHALERLYALYAEGDDALLKQIEQRKKQIAALKAQIAREEEAGEESREWQVRREQISTLGELWPSLNREKRRALVTALIERVTVTDQAVDVDFLV